MHLKRRHEYLRFGSKADMCSAEAPVCFGTETNIASHQSVGSDVCVDLSRNAPGWPLVIRKL